VNPLEFLNKLVSEKEEEKKEILKQAIPKVVSQTAIWQQKKEDSDSDSLEDLEKSKKIRFSPNWNEDRN